MNNKVPNNRAWLLVLPMLVLVAFSAIIPLMTVVNYSVQDVLGPNARFFTGTEWFQSMLNDDALQAAFLRQISFSLIILAIQIPLGIGIALIMPKRSNVVSEPRPPQQEPHHKTGRNGDEKAHICGGALKQHHISGRKHILKRREVCCGWENV